MTAPIALQLYTVREAIAQQDFTSVVRQVTEIGYQGVETAGFPGMTAKAAGQLFKDLGLTVTSIHYFPIPNRDKVTEVLDILGAIDCQHLVTGAGRDDFKTVDDIKRTCDAFNQAYALFSPHGVAVSIHNHWWEYLKVGDRYAYEYLFELTSPEIFFEVDTYWVKTAGVDPAGIVRSLGKRAPLLHIKDGPAERGQPMQAIGDGVMDFRAIVDAANGNTEWMIVELDACATDMLTAVKRSYDYLTSEGLAR
jgi:sugar phosphate isomerase/epimerase